MKRRELLIGAAGTALVAAIPASVLAASAGAQVEILPLDQDWTRADVDEFRDLCIWMSKSAERHAEFKTLVIELPHDLLIQAMEELNRVAAKTITAIHPSGLTATINPGHVHFEYRDFDWEKYYGWETNTQG
jgi:hypothetical protein